MKTNIKKNHFPILALDTTRLYICTCTIYVCNEFIIHLLFTKVFYQNMTKTAVATS